VLEIRPAHPGSEKWLVTLQNMATDGLIHPDGRPKNLCHGALILMESDIPIPLPPLGRRLGITHEDAQTSIQGPVHRGTVAL
jgi:hypothetical protein